MMTDNQKEVAARKLCELRGIEEDQNTPHSASPDENGFIPAVLLHSPAWKLALREIEAISQILEAIEYGKEREK